jgi:hypothetical protein
MVSFVYFVLIIQAPRKPKGEPMIQFVAMHWFHLVFVLVLLNIHEICLKLKSGFRIIHKFPTFQKPYFCVYSILPMAGPSDAMKLERFDGGENFRCWQNKVKFWLMSMGLWWVIHPMMPLMIPQAAAYPTPRDSAFGCLLTLLVDNLYDIYMDYKDLTELWDALECKYDVSEDGRLLYICEQLFEFSIDAAKSIVTQAHEFQLLTGEIASLGCPITDRVVASGIIAKLPTSWRDFATSLKHKREDISTESLITTLDVEEKTRAKDAPSTSATAENGASANVVVGKNNHNNKNKEKMQSSGKPKKTTNFKKNTGKDNRACFVCGK